MLDLDYIEFETNFTAAQKEEVFFVVMDSIAAYCIETFPNTFLGDPSYPDFYCIGPDYKRPGSTIIFWVDFADQLPCDTATIYMDGMNQDSIYWFANSLFALGFGVIKRITIWDDEISGMQVITQLSKCAH